MDHIDTNELLDFADRLQQAMDEVPPSHLHEPLAEGKWNRYQILLHIVDSELVYLARLKRVLTEDEPQLPGWQQAPWVDLEAGEVDITGNIALVRSVRSKLAAIISSLEEDDLQRHGVHLKYGRLSFVELVNRLVNHGNDHLSSITS